MEFLNSIVGFISKLIKWWFIVMPWEQAIRVRAGKKVKVLGEGIYFRIPFIDAVYTQTTRMRTVEIPMQTISSRNGISITVKSYIGYTIANILTLYKELYHPEATLGSIVMGAISEYVRDHDLNEMSQSKIEFIINERVKSVDYGLKDISFRITTFAVVKTFRLIQDSSYMYGGDLKMEALV